MSKHNKKRNTAFIYEALVREVVKQSIAKNTRKRNLAISLLKEYFNKNTLLYKDLQLYKSILETRQVKEKIAFKILVEAKTVKSNLDKKTLFTEQSKIIKKINKDLSPDVFMNYIPTYKYLASIGMFFGDNLNPKQKVLLEEKILEYMTFTESKDNFEEDKKVDNLVVKSFVKRFNDSYSKSLLSEQKELINHFINSADPERKVEFKLYVDREIERLKSTLTENSLSDEIKKDTNIEAKLNKVLEFLKTTNQKKINESFILKIAQIQQLVKEIQTND
tara:strand:- start:36 stop:866 length:831 start_codon:yes stop_codon:yes gene_type:complete